VNDFWMIHLMRMIRVLQRNPLAVFRGKEEWFVLKIVDSVDML